MSSRLNKQQLTRALEEARIAVPPSATITQLRTLYDRIPVPTDESETEVTYASPLEARSVNTAVPIASISPVPPPPADPAVEDLSEAEDELPSLLSDDGIPRQPLPVVNDVDLDAELNQLRKRRENRSSQSRIA